MHAGAATARVPGGGLLTGGKVTVTLGDVGVHKLCVSNNRQPVARRSLLYRYGTGKLNETEHSGVIERPGALFP